MSWVLEFHMYIDVSCGYTVAFSGSLKDHYSIGQLLSTKRMNSRHQDLHLLQVL